MTGDCCIELTICYYDGELNTCETVLPTKNGDEGYTFNFLSSHYLIYFDGSKWIIKDELNNVFAFISSEESTGCPSNPIWNIGVPEKIHSISSIEISCDVVDLCDCGIELSYFTNLDGARVVSFLVVGEQNGQHVFQGIINDEVVSMYWSLVNGWIIVWGLIDDGGSTLAQLHQDIIGCPISPKESRSNWEIFWTKDDFRIDYSVGIQCATGLCGREDRYAKQFASIKLPISFTEQKRGFKDCCCEQIVLASSETESWKNDLTSAWIKLSNPSDSVEFRCLDESNNLVTMISAIPFVNEPNAFYGSLYWIDILNAAGAGCYKIEVRYNIAGIEGTINWGTYKLKEYSIENALTTARVSAIFDGYHEIEGINFSGSNVPSTFRFHGFIGFRQPNYEIDNLIYEDRQMKRNIRENLNAYEIITEASDECIIRPLVELYLLSENELFISDYNAHNHSYRYLDLPVIVQESPKIEYTDQFARKAVLKCTVGDKFKNKRTYY